jgi:hypothetical protein
MKMSAALVTVIMLGLLDECGTLRARSGGTGILVTNHALQPP